MHHLDWGMCGGTCVGHVSQSSVHAGQHDNPGAELEGTKSTWQLTVITDSMSAVLASALSRDSSRLPAATARTRRSGRVCTSHSVRCRPADLPWCVSPHTWPCSRPASALQAAQMCSHRHNASILFQFTKWHSLSHLR